MEANLNKQQLRSRFPIVVMGVRGLTSFIARHAELYLTPYELHDCNLVIDGDNLACNLFKDVTGTYSAFGGDYDDFYRAVVGFFHVLAECNVYPYVLMDGGYEYRKLRTVEKRLRGKIAVIKRINPNGSITLFPLLMKEVFLDAVRDCNVPVMRCLFEADDELAALGRKLHCPVLSYDSDFYIHNVQYIPLITLTIKAHTKRYDDNGDSAGSADPKSPRRLRKNEARHVEKRTKGHRIVNDIRVDNVEKRSPKSGKTYKYLDCCMYRIENLIARGSLSKEKLPLFAAMLGNDYISRTAFRNFFAVGLGKVGRSRKAKQQQRRIRAILQWLKNETAESALEKILTRLKKGQRKSLVEQVRAATSGYSNEKCQSYDFFVANYENPFIAFPVEAETEDQEENESNSGSESGVEENGDDRDTEDEANQEDSNDSESRDNENKEDVTGWQMSDAESDGEEEPLDENESGEDERQKFPPWFLEKLHPAHLSRFFVDLMHLQKYINSPQIEHFPYPDCHEIALPILTYIYTLLSSVEGEEREAKMDEEGNQIPLGFTYLTRATRFTNIRYCRYTIKEPPPYAFNPSQPNPLLFRKNFEDIKQGLRCELLFEKVTELPEDLRLYFLAIVYWLQKSPYCDLLHLHAIVLCLVVLRTIDSTIPAERDLKAFQKRFGKIIKKERQVRDKEAAEGVQRGIKEELKALPIPERMAYVPKSDCYLVQNDLLKHFHMQEIFKKKYDLYSTIVLHSFAEFQSVVFQLNALNSLLGFPYGSPRMGQSFCGVFIYNLYDLLRTRVDVRYYVQHFIFADSQLMFDFYCYLMDWCEPFVPHGKRPQAQRVTRSMKKKVLRKQRRAARRTTEEAESADPNQDMVDCSSDKDEEEFFDFNNKLCAFHKKGRDENSPHTTLRHLTFAL